MRVLLLCHDGASSVTPRTSVQIHTALAQHHEVNVIKTHARSAATQLARSAAMDGIDVVAVLGGDGTLNEAANGLVGTDCALAALPGGSTNVFARSIGTDDDPLRATAQIIQALAEGALRPASTGEVSAVDIDGNATQPRAFLTHCGIGFDAAVVRWAEQHRLLKRYVSHALYLAAGLGVLVKQRFAPAPSLVIETEAAREPNWSPNWPDPPDRPSSPDWPSSSNWTVALNNDPYTYLGRRGVHIAPAAGLDRPLSVAAIRRAPPLRMLRLTRAALATSPASSDDFAQANADVFWRVDDQARLALTAHHSRTGAPVAVDYQIDGEYLGAAHEISVTHRPDALRLVLPVLDR